MAEPFLSLKRHERGDILRTVAANSGRSAVILEKDIWVCWVLQALFSMSDLHPMAFKGGTSLSKVYGIIDRFSEDVDITLDYRAFNDGFDPFADSASRNQIRLSTSATTARQSASPIRPQSRSRAAMSGARFCSNSAAATSSIRTSNTRSFPTLPPSHRTSTIRPRT